MRWARATTSRALRYIQAHMQAPDTPRPGLRLADHVRACCVDSSVILLDMRRGRYMGVAAGGSTEARALVDALDGRPSPPVGSSSSADAVDIDRLCSPLLAQGMVTREPPTGRQPTTFREPVQSLNADDVIAYPSIGWRRTIRLLRETFATSLQLRLRSLEQIADAVSAQQACTDPTVLPALLEAVAAYLRLRLYVFTAHDQCLNDSLTLLRFLAAERLSATWVIGVKVRPFGAHSWVQWGDTVLNDQHDRVRGYRPILVV